MKQFKTTIRLSWDDLDLLTAYQTAKNIPVRTEAIMRAVKEACAREKITVAILPETMRASYMLTRPEEKPIETPIQEKEISEEAKEGLEEEEGVWYCKHQKLESRKKCTIEKHDQCVECFTEGSKWWDTCKEILAEVREEIVEKTPKEKPITQNSTPNLETATPIVAPQPQEPSVIEETDIEAQQAAQIKAIRERLEKKPPGQQKLGEE